MYHRQFIIKYVWYYREQEQSRPLELRNTEIAFKRLISCVAPPIIIIIHNNHCRRRHQKLDSPQNRKWAEKKNVSDIIAAPSKNTQKWIRSADTQRTYNEMGMKLGQKKKKKNLKRVKEISREASDHISKIENVPALFKSDAVEWNTWRIYAKPYELRCCHKRRRHLKFIQIANYTESQVKCLKCIYIYIWNAFCRTSDDDGKDTFEKRIILLLV